MNISVVLGDTRKLYQRKLFGTVKTVTVGSDNIFAAGGIFDVPRLFPLFFKTALYIFLVHYLTHVGRSLCKKILTRVCGNIISLGDILTLVCLI